MSTEVDEAFVQQFEVVKEVISNVRSIRLQKNIAQKEPLELQVVGETRWLLRCLSLSRCATFLP